MENSTNTKHPLPMLKRWAMAINGCNVPDIEKVDFITKWLIISRACVFSMTFTSGLIGVLLAMENGNVKWQYAVLSVIGLLLAHAANNVINDYTDVKKGVDTEDYPRAQYSVHPLLGGLTTPKGLLRAAFIFTFIDAIIMIYLATVRGPWVIFFAVSGFLLSLGYTGILKRIGLGELTALIVWGPLMIGGTAFVSLGAINNNIWLATLPYGLIVASVLVGKHVDKIDSDIPVGVRSIPVLIGEKRSLTLNKFFFILFYILIFGLVIFKITGPWILITLFAVPRLRQAWKIYSEPKPKEAPEEWTVWPLWYVGWAMHFNRKAGELFIFGLLLNIIVPRIF